MNGGDHFRNSHHECVSKYLQEHHRHTTSQSGRIADARQAQDVSVAGLGLLKDEQQGFTYFRNSQKRSLYVLHLVV